MKKNRELQPLDILIEIVPIVLGWGLGIISIAWLFSWIF